VVAVSSPEDATEPPVWLVSKEEPAQ
jgi:hypothetical protein